MHRIYHVSYHRAGSWFHSHAGRTTVGFSLVGSLGVLIYGLGSMVHPSPAPYGALSAPGPSFNDVKMTSDPVQPASGTRAAATDGPIVPQVYPDLGIGDNGR
jgi:hypothetical protein